MTTATQTLVRCAIYTRKSTEEGLEQAFNSLDAQREAAEAYVASQRQAGWVRVGEPYADGGFSGATLQRPALQRLLADIAAGQIDCVLVHRIDRLSRSLLDFARMMELFEKHQIALVSITQQFNTATSMGRLLLHVLLSFAQFEREIISERTRDKIAAARRKGIWCGGMPVLGYDLNTERQLQVNPAEAHQVRSIFRLYLQHGSLRRLLQEVDQRGWQTKCWRTRQGCVRGGKAFTKSTLYQLLTNVTYLGQVRYKHEAHAGEHPAIVHSKLWQQVQVRLRQLGRGESASRQSSPALLKGKLFCGRCGHALTPTYGKVRNKQYGYYVCTLRQKLGRQRCSLRPLAVSHLEQAVLEQLRTLAHDPVRWYACLQQAEPWAASRLAELNQEKAQLRQEHKTWKQALRTLAQQVAADQQANANALTELAQLRDQAAASERRRTELNEEMQSLRRQQVTLPELRRLALRWREFSLALAPEGQRQIVQQVIQRLDCTTDQITMTFHPAGIKSLAEAVAAEVLS